MSHSSISRSLVFSLFVSAIALASEAPVAQVKPPPPVRVESRVVLPVKNAEGSYEREIKQHNHRLTLNLAPQVMHLDVPKQDSWRGPQEAIRAGDTVTVGKQGAMLMTGKTAVARVAAGQLLAVREVKDGWLSTSTIEKGQIKSGWLPLSGVRFHSEAVPVQPTLGGLTQSEFTSASALAQKAKQFDDGLYAAVERAAQDGLGTLAGKRKLLAELGKHFANRRAGSEDQPIIMVLAAARLGDAQAAVPAAYTAGVQRAIAGFQANPLRSKPIGFYTWSDEQRRIFAQDRMLQSPLEGRAGIAALSEALQSDAAARATYEKYLSLVSGLTNPLAYPDLRTAMAPTESAAKPPASGLYFFPPSRAHETDLVMKLYGNRPIPDNFNLADALIERVKSGAIQLAPKADSGWYDYQTWSLEPLVVPDSTPEAAKLSLSLTYQEHLRELFKGVLALARETHVKQLDFPAPAADAGAPERRLEFFVGPELTVEPLVESYRRRAASYRFVRSVLETAFGSEALATMHRLTAAGPVSASLDSELSEMEGLFAGAAITAAWQLGMDADAPGGGSGTDPAADAARFLAWGANLPLDSDVGQDARMMVPVFYDQQRKQTKVWAFLGWSAQGLGISLTKPFTTTVVDAAGKTLDPKSYDLHIGGNWASLATPVVAEVYVNNLLDRDEFRRHCDAYVTREAILANLK